MRVFLFQSRVNDKMIGFTLHALGANLPRSLAPWDYVIGEEMTPRIPQWLQDAVANGGYYLMDRTLKDPNEPGSRSIH